MVKIAVIVGSTRPKRFGPQIANWIMKLSKDHPDAIFELVDLQVANLPFLDEPEVPSSGNYSQEHTKKWSAMVASFDGFVWVHPEYNHGVSAPLKNAIDFLWKEWNDKPVALAGYGAEAGGARAAEQLHSIAIGCKMFPLRSGVTIASYTQYLDANGVFQPTEPQTKAANNMLTELIFWAVQMKRARNERT